MEKLTWIAEPLLAWYQENARDLPWRNTCNPYEIWISEVMLQQTRAEVVCSYYQNFLYALPGIEDLAAADEGQLLKLWEGLGYYSRVRNLHRAAQQVIKTYHGELPADYNKLLSLPGIGEYSAGAIASIAFGMPVAAVDGNVMRVLSRLIASHDDINQGKVKKQNKIWLEEVMPVDSPGDFNQALMDLGAMICLPKALTHCEVCPLAQNCLAYLRGETSQLPFRSPKKSRRIERRTVLRIECQDRVLLHQRPVRGLLATLWEFPNLDGWCTKVVAQEFARVNGFNCRKIQKLPAAKHIFTHLEWHMHGWRLLVEQPPDLGSDYVWCTNEELNKHYGIPHAFSAYNTDSILKPWS